jgi:hypothetical protein
MEEGIVPGGSSEGDAEVLREMVEERKAQARGDADESRFVFSSDSKNGALLQQFPKLN